MEEPKDVAWQSQLARTIRASGSFRGTREASKELALVGPSWPYAQTLAFIGIDNELCTTSTSSTTIFFWSCNMAPLAGQKRKVDYNRPDTPAQARKRQKGKDARVIPTQTADAALSTAGELHIPSFVKAREFEIAALDSSMKKARKTLTQRAFQQVPRHMRRRTASHNVKKVPRRLQGRAAREVRPANKRVTLVLTR